MKELLDKRLPDEAVTPHPTKAYLSNIKAIYVTERLNDVFGVGAWSTSVEHVATDGKMVVVKLTLAIPDYGIRYECYGGNDNADLGDAYKGATTDALTKICSWMGLGADVFKGLQTGKQSQRATAKRASNKRPITTEDLGDALTLDSLLAWLWKADSDGGCSPTFDCVEFARKYYDLDNGTAEQLRNHYARYRVAKMTPKL